MSFMSGPLTHRVPTVSLVLGAAMLGVFSFWQGGEVSGADDLLRRGASSFALMVELGQWWRLFTASFVHGSWEHLGATLLTLVVVGRFTESTLGRLDYLWVVSASALGAATVAALGFTHGYGAGGIIAGLMGAEAVLGARQRSPLFGGHRRWFFVILVLYPAYVVTRGPDGAAWLLLGGALGGALASVFVAPLHAPVHAGVADATRATKLLALVMTPLVLGVATLVSTGGETFEHSWRGFVPPPEPLKTRLGLELNAPPWPLVLRHQHARRETFSFRNDAGASLTLRAQKHTMPEPLEPPTKGLLEHQLASELQMLDAVASHIEHIETTEVEGYPGQRLTLLALTPKGVMRAVILTLTRGHYRYSVTVATPWWLFPLYERRLASVLKSIRVTDPYELERARRLAAGEPSPESWASLAASLDAAGEGRTARELIHKGRLRWPSADSLELPQVVARAGAAGGSLSR